MRKLVTVIGLCAAILGYAAIAGGAATTEVIGSYSGTEHFLTDATCGIARDFTNATATVTSLGAVTMSLQLCITESLSSLGAGTPLTLASGSSSLSGHVTSGTLTLGVGPTGGPRATFSADVVIDTGTGTFAGITGTLNITGTANAGFGPPGTDVPANGSITGTLTIPEVPSTTAQCKNGGWRNLQNTDGAPFKSQGECVSFVVRSPS